MWLTWSYAVVFADVAAVPNDYYYGTINSAAGKRAPVLRTSESHIQLPYSYEFVNRAREYKCIRNKITFCYTDLVKGVFNSVFIDVQRTNESCYRVITYVKKGIIMRFANKKYNVFCTEDNGVTLEITIYLKTSLVPQTLGGTNVMSINYIVYICIKYACQTTSRNWYTPLYKLRFCLYQYIYKFNWWHTTVNNFLEKLRFSAWLTFWKYYFLPVINDTWVKYTFFQIHSFF